MQQNAFTVITRIKSDQVDQLNGLLTQMGQQITADTGHGGLCLRDISTLHFACWVILPTEPGIPSELVFESNHDGDTETHLKELVARAGKGLDAIYSLCEGYPAGGAQNPEAIAGYLRAHSVSTPAFYIGCPGQSLGSVRNAIAVRKEIETFLDELGQTEPISQMSPIQVYARIAERLKQPDATRPQVSPITLDGYGARAKQNLILLLLVGIPLILLTLPLLALFVIALRINEIRDAKAPLPPPLTVDPRLFEVEDIYVQNHLTTLVDVKPGKFRLYTLKGVLWLINLLARTYFTTGQLGGIPTIHFARWILMDNDRRLLFFSNYDGSWASYLGDFVDKANYGLTAVWSNTDRFPPAQWLFFGGAQHIEAFKEWSREHNVFAPIWYSAYPDETLWNLQKDIRIRDTVGKPLSEAEASTFLQAF
jgi:hypothetical protein